MSSFIEAVEQRLQERAGSWRNVIDWSVFRNALTECLAEAGPVAKTDDEGCAWALDGSGLPNVPPGTLLFTAPPADAARIAELKGENSALRELMNCYNLGGWTDSLALIKERDEMAKRATRMEGAVVLLEKERDELRTQLATAQAVVDAARNLIAQKGRHNTEQAYKRLATAIAPDQSAAGSGK